MAMAAIPNTIERTGTAARGWAGHARVRLVQQAGSYSASKVADVGLAELGPPGKRVPARAAHGPPTRSPPPRGLCPPLGSTVPGVMAHTFTAISGHGVLARGVFDDSPTQGHAALGAIRTGSHEAMAEIRATLGGLRDVDGGAAPRSPIPTLEQVDGLIAEAQRAGLRATAEVTGDPRPVPAAVDTTAFRIVQESLTNVVRHARANCVPIRIRYEPAALSIDVPDTGTGADGR